MPLLFPLTYPEDLPVSQERERICRALREHQVIIVCGDTGSGKTTQLPKMIAEVLGPDSRGKIGITQPRRLAATRMAARVAEECQVPLGKEVGVRVRFDDRTSRSTRIQFMTDGLLLAQLPQDPDWSEYQALMIDEAHERSLNIDFLLGCLHDLLPRRPDLKVVLSSATLDAERFSEFFGGAPVLQVEGRLYPIRDEYLPGDGGDRPLPDRVMEALEHLDRLQTGLDTLIFLPGEREIRETANKLSGSWKGDADLLPLFARLGGPDQDKAFRPSGRRRIILATNVAETSVTLPGIRAVIDTGEVRLQRFHPQSGIQRLVTESVSQASAKQRRGRCGRTGPGICLRMYAPGDLEQAPAYVDPEIRRSSLAEVILRMAVLGLPHLNEFPLLDPPKGAAINQGVRTLIDIGAMTADRHLTPRGRVLATFPLDPRLARMLEEGHEENLLAAVLIVVAFLSIQDPRERPAEKAEAADRAHAAWRDPSSDFLGILNCWNALISQPGQGRRNRFCRDHFLHPRRVREWINLVDDLRETCREHRWQVPDSVGEVELLDTDGLHRALLSGVPRSIGQREETRAFRTPNGQMFQVFPGSALAKKPPKWVMAFALVETSRLWARECAALNPDWVEQVAPHLLKTRYERPVWNADRGFVEAEERVQFGQLTLRFGTRVHYGRVDPVEARRIFLEDGLSPGNLPLPEKELASYRAFRASLEQWEHKLRRPGAFTDPASLTGYFQQRIPREIFTAKAFTRWARTNEWVPDIGDLIPEGVRMSEGLPDVLEVKGKSVQLEYRFAPEEPEADGVMFVIREVDLDGLPPELVEWTAPAWLPEKVEGLIRSLDKRLRTPCAPYSQTAEAALAWMKQEGFLFTHSLTGALAAFLAAKLDCILAAPDLHPEALAPHLRSRLRIVDEAGKVRYEGETCPEQLKPSSPSESTASPSLPKGNQTNPVPLFRERHPEVVKFFQKQFPLSTHTQLSLTLENAVGENALEDLQAGILFAALTLEHPHPESPEELEQAFTAARTHLFEIAEKACRHLEQIYELRAEVEDRISSLAEGPLRQDLELQQHLLWRAGWCSRVAQLERIPVYLKGMELRIERALRNPAKDAKKAQELEPALAAFAEHADRLSPEHTQEALDRLEELRVALFAPELGVQGKHSHQRFVKWLNEVS